MNVTQEDMMEGLKMEEPKEGHWPSPTTIFSWVLGPLANRQEVEESSAQLRDRAIECAPPPLRLEWEDCYVLVIASSMRQLTIGPGGDNIRRGRNLLQSHWRVAIFLPHCTAMPAGGHHLGRSKCLLHRPYHRGHHRPGVRSWLKPAIGQMSYHPSLHDWTFPIHLPLGRQLTAWTFPL